jgi:hypothetical protein
LKSSSRSTSTVSVGGVRGDPGDVLGAGAGPGDDGDLVTLRRQKFGEEPADLSGADDCVSVGHGDALTLVSSMSRAMPEA